MHIASIQFNGFKRFTDTRVTDIPETARLVVLAGPNGSGKSSIFDGLQTWHSFNGRNAYNWDESYGAKVGSPQIEWTQRVSVDFHEPLPASPEERKKLVYIRTAFRNEAEFQIQSLNRLQSPLDGIRSLRLIDNDVSVSDNYQRLVLETIYGIYDDQIPDTTTKADIRNRIIGEVQAAMSQVFPDLVLTGVGAITGASDALGTFYFRKGNAKEFLYKNLSAGEKSAFDLILDAVAKRKYFDNTIWCIDEPETHLNTRIQGAVLQALVSLVPSNCQLWIASHSLGFMRKAWEMARSNNESVAFIDMQGQNFDEPVTLVPIHPSREFWGRTLEVALGDMAELVAPEHIVLCEGRPNNGGANRRAAFDAQCYAVIFAGEHPNTDFISVGSSADVSQDRLEFGATIKALTSGTRVDRLIDRDHLSDQEVKEKNRQGIRVLGRRHIEAYLLDDEVLRALCLKAESPDRYHEAIELKNKAVASSVARGNDPDDLKSAAGEVFSGLRTLLRLSHAGSSWEVFARETLTPLITPNMGVYKELHDVIFGDGELPP